MKAQKMVTPLKMLQDDATLAYDDQGIVQDHDMHR